jgi:hypothetical protein
MTISEFSQRIDRIVGQLDSEIERQASIAGADLVALIAQRVVQSGKDADGALFSPYSEAQVPAFFYLNRSRSGSADQKVRAKAKKKEPISYREFRQINNLNAAPKNFEFTGDMWRNFGVLKVQRTASGATVTIGGRKADAEDKITWNSEREGRSIIKPSPQELAIVTANLKRWAQNIVNG